MAAENKDGWAGRLCLGAMNSRHSQGLSAHLMSAMTVCKCVCQCVLCSYSPLISSSIRSFSLVLCPVNATIAQVNLAIMIRLYCYLLIVSSFMKIFAFYSCCVVAITTMSTSATTLKYSNTRMVDKFFIRT